MKLKTLLSFLVILLSTIAISAQNNKNNNSKPIIDIDGNSYSTITIGAQTWMTENLKTTRFNDGTAIPMVSDDEKWEKQRTPAYCFYNNEKDSASIYGALYNWYAINTGKICPEGWHVPDETEWETLKAHLTSSIPDGRHIPEMENDEHGYKTAKMLASKNGWKYFTEAGTVGHKQEENNASGFSALAAGSRSFSGKYNSINEETTWWSTTQKGHNRVSTMYITYTSTYIYDGSSVTKNYGLSVRCLKD